MTRVRRREDLDERSGAAGAGAGVRGAGEAYVSAAASREKRGNGRGAVPAKSGTDVPPTPRPGCEQRREGAQRALWEISTLE